MHDLTIKLDNTVYSLYDDFGCIAKTYTIANPQPYTTTVSVPYRNGVLDMTEAVASGVRYKNRNIVIPVLIVSENPINAYYRISDTLHGQACKVTLSEFQDRYYRGRVSIGDLAGSKGKWQFDFTVNAYPYRIKDYSYQVDSPFMLNIVNDGIDTVPTIITDNTIGLTLDDQEAINLTAGTHVDARFRLSKGEHQIVSTGYASVQIKYEDKVL